MPTKRLINIWFVLLISISGAAQQPDYARSVVDTLSSPFMYGRGYINKGDSLAAAFIASQFEKLGLKHFGNDYFQPFTLSVNTFPGNVNVNLNGVALQPGSEFVVGAASHSDHGIYPVKVLKQKILCNPVKLQRFNRRDHSGCYIYYDIDIQNNQSREAWRKADSLVQTNPTGARGAILPRQAVSWHVWAKEMSEHPFTTVNVRKDVIPAKLKSISTDIEARRIESYITRNVIARIPGKTQPDTFLVVCAHYDHLGMMGQKTVFPGANDNASGTAMLLDLARHYSLPENHFGYSLVFMAFAGEETGLLGSKYYTGNPYFRLEQIKFLVNLDMVGTGSDGLLVFNGSADSLRFENLMNINRKKGYLKELKVRGGSPNSDHYYFHEKGVPAFFLLTIGCEHRHYHNIYDTRELLPLTRYSEVFRLITDFFDTF